MRGKAGQPWSHGRRRVSLGSRGAGAGRHVGSHGFFVGPRRGRAVAARGGRSWRAAGRRAWTGLRCVGAPSCATRRGSIAGAVSELAAFAAYVHDLGDVAAAGRVHDAGFPFAHAVPHSGRGLHIRRAAESAAGACRCSALRGARCSLQPAAIRDAAPRHARAHAWPSRRQERSAASRAAPPPVASQQTVSLAPPPASWGRLVGAGSRGSCGIAEPRFAAGMSLAEAGPALRKGAAGGVGAGGA